MNSLLLVLALCAPPTLAKPHDPIDDWVSKAVGCAHQAVAQAPYDLKDAVKEEIRLKPPRIALYSAATKPEVGTLAPGRGGRGGMWKDPRYRHKIFEIDSDYQGKVQLVKIGNLTMRKPDKWIKGLDIGQLRPGDEIVFDEETIIFMKRVSDPKTHENDHYDCEVLDWKECLKRYQAAMAKKR